MASWIASIHLWEKKYICDYFLYAWNRWQTCFEYYMSTYFKYFLSVHSPFTDLAVTCSENVVESVFVKKFKMQWRFWFLCLQRESEKGLTFQSCYILDKTNKIMYKCKINKDFELNIFIKVYKIYMLSAMNW